MLLPLVFTILLPILCVYIFKRFNEYYKFFLRLPKVTKNAIFVYYKAFKNRGHTYELVNELMKITNENRDKNIRTMTIWLGTMPSVISVDPNFIEEASNKLTYKPDYYDSLKCWIGEGLLTSSGIKWKRTRKFVTPSFNFKKIEAYLPVMRKQSNNLLKKISAMNNSTIDLCSYIPSTALDIVFETAMGVSSEENSSVTYANAILTVSEIIIQKTVTQLIGIDFLFDFTSNGRKMYRSIKIINDFCRNVINDKMKAMQERNFKSDGAFIDLMIDAHLKYKANVPDSIPITMDDIVCEISTFMVAGFETTSLLMSWTLYILGLYPEIQEKVFDEIVENFGYEDIEVSGEKLKNLRYLESCLKETLRLYPSVPIIGKRTTEKTRIAGYDLPKDATIILFIYGLHQDKEVFPDPEKFIPERFAQTNENERNPYAYIPFSAGARSCIGQKFAMSESKILISTIIQKYKIRSLKQREEIPIDIEITLKVKEPLNVIFTERK